MKIRNLFWGAFAMIILWSCEPNEPDSVYVNTAPVIKDQSFSAKEDISSTYIIGTVTAKDEVDNDKITFSIYADDSGLFEISPSGKLSLAQGKHLDFETVEAHTITVRAYDGIVGRYAKITINVEDVEPEPDSPTIVLDTGSLELYNGDTTSLNASTTNADGLTIGWASDNEAVATVDQDGNVTAVGVGTAIITATLAKSSSSATVTVVPNVYVAGIDISGNTDVAVLWKNGVAYNLTDGTNNARANSVFVDDNGTVHVAGYETINGIKVAMLWKKDGDAIQAIELPNQGNPTQANSVFVNDNGITFVVGSMESGGTQTAMLWRNQVANPLPTTGPGYDDANSVFVDDGGNVYVAGFEIINGFYVPRIWENEASTDLPSDNNNASAYSVFVNDGGNVYVVGFETINNISVAKIWQNGIPSNLTDGINSASAFSVFVDGIDVYAVGREDVNGIFTAKLWKNGVVSDLQVSNASSANSVFVHNTDIYVSGYEFENGLYVAKLWVNGEPTDLGTGYGNSVFVK